MLEFVLISGGDCIHVLVILTFSVLLSYFIICYRNIMKKSKYINSNKFILKSISQKILKSTNGKNYLIVYLNSVREKLRLLQNPFGLTLTKYLIIKYIISFTLLIGGYLRSNNIILSVILFLIMFFLPNILIHYFIKNEKLKLISDISNIVQSLILSLSINMPLQDSLLLSVNSVKYDRFKVNYQKFVNDYLMYNLNIKKSIEEFSQKFNSYEFNMFLSVLSDFDKEIRNIRRTGNIFTNIRNVVL